MFAKLVEFLKGTSLLICIIFITVKPTITKENFCYSVVFLKTSWTDRRPYFKVNMTFTNTGIRSLTWVEQDIASPITKLRVFQTDGDNKVINLYNLTARLCDVQQLLLKVPMFQTVVDKALKHGNYSFVCPLKKGHYVMDNIRISNRDAMLALMYRPKTTFTFIGGLYEEVPNKSVLPLTTYNFTAKIVKRSCKES